MALEQYYIQLLSSYQVEGLIINAVGMREEELNRLLQARLPMTLIDRKIEGVECNVIGLKNSEASQQVTRHLIDQGFTALLFISEIIGSVNTRRERQIAFQDTVARAEGVCGESTEISLQQTETLRHRILDFLQRHAQQPCAIVTANGTLTLQVMKVLQAESLECGRDLGLAGFDEMSWSSLVGRGITTLKQPTHKIGYSALQSVISLIKQPKKTPTEQFFSGELIVRGSSTLD